LRSENFLSILSPDDSGFNSESGSIEANNIAQTVTNERVQPDKRSGSTPISTNLDLPQHSPDGDQKRRRSAEEEVERLKRELAFAAQTIANQEVELEQNRLASLTMEQVVTSPAQFEPRTTSLLRSGKSAMVVDPFARQLTIGPYTDGGSEYGDAYIPGPPTGIPEIWSNNVKPNNVMDLGQQSRQFSVAQSNSGWNTPSRSPSAQSSAVGGVSLAPDTRCYHAFIDPSLLPDRTDRGMGDMMLTRPGSTLSTDSRWYMNGWAPSRPESPTKPTGHYYTGNNAVLNDIKPPRAVGSRSPTHCEPTFERPALFPGSWNTQAGILPPSNAYATASEPLNYRRLLDRNMSCDWKFVVDKIVCSNDQQASIFLQQKLKLGTQEQKFEIVQAIIAQAYSLMTNRFGNFLVQRCFEHGSPEQIEAIAKAICGNTLNLSMDPFGCHVVQKALDCVPEGYKAIMVHELLRRIPDTVIHRYACHVWQKLFELRWSDSPPQIMKYVNEALRGMWHEVALGETGSLVVQNIFENCLEEDKRPCINEVLSSVDIIAHGQFGNWCIQHICEHGAPADRNRAIDHILRFATEYSTDQYASKVIEKCLKIGGNDFLEKYLDRVCQSRADRPRIPLIDISGDQFGNYLIQWILTNSAAQHREIVAAHIRKHMVSLRGSKYGSRVAMLCSNPANQIRPGPPTGLLQRGYSNSSSGRGPYGTGFRQA